MKKISLNFLALTVIAFIVLAFTVVKSGGIKGNVSPADGATAILAVSGTDTLKATLNSGNFNFSDVKPGTYNIVVKGKSPYKDSSVENVAVIDSTVTDVGEIKLQQ